MKGKPCVCNSPWTPLCGACDGFKEDKLVWHKFTDKEPPIAILWLSDYEKVWIDPSIVLRERTGLWWGDAEVWAISDLKYPPVPKKEVHWCPDSLINPRLICTQNVVGNLIIQTHNEKGNRYVFEANFCPFCGFTTEEK